MYLGGQNFCPAHFLRSFRCLFSIALAEGGVESRSWKMRLFPGGDYCFKIPALLLLGSLCLSGQTLPLQSVEAVLEAVWDANGGLENVQSVRSIRAVGSIEGEDDNVDLILVRKRPNLKRVIRRFKGRIVEMGYNGEICWKTLEVSGKTRVRVEPSDEEISSFVRDSSIDDVIFRPESETLEHTLLEPAYVDRVPCYVILSQSQDGARLSFIDSRTFRLLRIALPEDRDADGNPTQHMDLFEYERLEGMWIARSMNRVVEGVTQTTLRFESVQMNIGIFDSYFDPPAGVDFVDVAK